MAARATQFLLRTIENRADGVRLDFSLLSFGRQSGHQNLTPSWSSTQSARHGSRGSSHGRPHSSQRTGVSMSAVGTGPVTARSSRPSPRDR